MLHSIRHRRRTIKEPDRFGNQDIENRELVESWG